MTGADDQKPTWPAGDPTAGDLAAMVRVLEQRCREAEGQARLAEQGRRRFEQLFHQQPVQTDINAHGRQQVEGATPAGPQHYGASHRGAPARWRRRC